MDNVIPAVSIMVRHTAGGITPRAQMRVAPCCNVPSADYSMLRRSFPETSREHGRTTRAGADAVFVVSVRGILYTMSTSPVPQNTK